MSSFSLLRPALTCAFLAGFAGVAPAQEAPASGGAWIGRLFDAAKLRSAPAPTPDFVHDSRSEHLEYRAFDAPADRKAGRKTAAELRADGAGLDAALAENRRKAARVATPDAPKK
ncbi:hypothetical protein V3H18_07510 [Methylocystis sp. 9N]|uniref:Uncharacterized protein n=1 Tax=Methylocystis borbori TaxID=3118750 RepID=A0ABU7XG90_9HYPH